MILFFMEFVKNVSAKNLFIFPLNKKINFIIMRV